MTGNKKHYLLTLTAESDFRQARQWSKKRWGTALTKQYFQDLHSGAEYLAQNFHLLPDRQDISGMTGIGAYPVREHYIIYVPVAKNQIIIVALIRQTRDVPAILQANHYRIQKEMESISGKLENGEIPDLPLH